jgi:hypothetical protein
MRRRSGLKIEAEFDSCRRLRNFRPLKERRLDRSRKGLQPGISRLAVKREDADALMDSP